MNEEQFKTIDWNKLIELNFPKNKWKYAKNIIREGHRRIALQINRATQAHS